jgi:tetratricopeptide (TPR) repeat protein
MILRRLCVCWLTVFLCGSVTFAAQQSNAPSQSQSSAGSTQTDQAKPSATPDPKASADPIADPIHEALLLYRKGDFVGAQQKYEQVLEKQPKSSDAYAGLVRVYLKKKDVQRAFEIAERGRVVANSPAVQVALGEVYFRQGKIHEAENVWAIVVSQGHREARAYLGLARVQWAISMNKSAQSMIETAHELDPSDREIAKFWMSTLGRSRQIKYLQEYLASENNDDEETKKRLRQMLAYLEAIAQPTTAGCHLVNAVSNAEIPLIHLPADFSRFHACGLNVELNGQKSKLLLDTGASGILISRTQAEKAGLTRISDVDLAGIGDKGAAAGYVTIASSIKIGPMEFQNCEVHVIDQRSINGEDGLIGSNVFGNFLVDLDFPKQTLRLSELPKRPDDTAQPPALQTDAAEDRKGGDSATGPSGSSEKTAKPRSGPQDRYIAPEMQSYTKVYRFGHSLLVPTLVGNESESKLFLLDTGAFDNVITLDAAGEVTRLRGDHGTRIKGLNGSVDKVYRADKALIKFGHLQQHNQDLVALDLSHTSDQIGTEVSGMLGFVMLRLLEIKIDYRDGLVDFTYDPTRFGP